MKPNNFSNFNPEKELADQKLEDWKFGALSQPGIVTIPLGEREFWLPKGELQFSQYADYIDCATRSPINHLEALMTYGYQKQIFTEENRKWLQDNGYVKEGKIVLSNRFNAVLSGTTRQGNSLKSPIDSVYRDGVIPKYLLPEENLTFDEYHDATKITQAMKDLGKEFKKRIQLNYEQVDTKLHLKEANKDDCIGVAIHAYPAAKNGVYPRTEEQMNHAVLSIKPEYFIFDNYNENNDLNDFIKQLAPDYKFFQTGYRLYISGQATGTEYDTKVALYKKLIDLLTRWLDLLRKKS